MPVLARRRSRKRAPREESAQQDEAPPAAPRRRRRRRWLVVALPILAVVFWLPAIVARTPLLSWVLAIAAADLQGTVTVQSASLGWFSPIAADGLAIRDSGGEPVLQASGVRGDRSLVAILANTSRLGRFRLERPKLWVTLHSDGSNLEDVLKEYLAPTDEPADAVDIALTISKGSVSLTDQDSGQKWQIEDLELSLSSSGEAAAGLKLEASAKIADPQRPGRVAVALTLARPDPNGAASSGEANLDADAVPLAMFESLIGRFASQTRLTGRLSSKIHARWGGEAATSQARLQADLSTDGLTLSTPSLGTDSVRLERLQAACQMTWQDDVLKIEQSSVACDLANVTATAAIDLSQAWSGRLPTSALKQTGQLTGHVDLARLAAMLPETLRIREAAEVTSGRMEFALSSRPGEQGAVWKGRIEAANLTAVHGGRQLTWQQPVLLTLAAHDSATGPVVERLECRSDFLALDAAGTAQSLTASARFDLGQLAERLGQVVDLGELELAGNGWAHLNWKRSAEEQFEADADLQVRGFLLARPEQHPWKEENLLVFLSAVGETDSGAVSQVQNASVTVKTAADQIEAKLLRPVLDLRSGGAWPVHLKMQGQLQDWPARLGPWLALDDCEVAGSYDLDVEADGSAGGVTVRRAKLAVEQLQLLTPTLRVSEPKVEMWGSGGWDRQQRRVQIDPAVLTSSGLSLQAGNVTLTMPQQGPADMAGTIKYQGNLEPLSRWFVDPNAPPTWRVAGELAGTAQVTHSSGQIKVEANADLGNLMVVDASGEQFHEPRVHLTARGDYTQRDGRLRIEQLELNSMVLGGSAAGHIVAGADRSEVQISGEVSYDLQRLCDLLRPYLGREIRMAGRGTSPASYHGPLAPVEAQASAGIGWQWANVYGFAIGPGQLSARLADGMLQIEPLDLTVGQGHLRLTPQLQLAQPRELTLSPGPIVERVQIDPQMCASLLKYVAPVLAGVTSAEGAFSIDLDGCQIPLADPAQGEIAGRFTVHSVQIGPGPLVQELAVLLGRAAPATLRRESVVQFRMIQGRVYHEGLELIFPDLTIRTRGSVGLDQTLAIMAEMPIPPKWLGNNPLGSALRNQTIRIPIGGTLDRPQLDRRVLDQLSRQFLQKAARNVLQDEMNRQLDRLFAPPN